MFRIITVEREYGCGGGDIARILADRLGWTLWDNALTEEIAKIANVDPRTVCSCDERVDSTFSRLAKVFWRGSFERSMPFNPTFDADDMVEYVQQVLHTNVEVTLDQHRIVPRRPKHGGRRPPGHRLELAEDGGDVVGCMLCVDE